MTNKRNKRAGITEKIVQRISRKLEFQDFLQDNEKKSKDNEGELNFFLSTIKNDMNVKIKGHKNKFKEVYKMSIQLKSNVKQYKTNLNKSKKNEEIMILSKERLQILNRSALKRVHVSANAKIVSDKKANSRLLKIQKVTTNIQDLKFDYIESKFESQNLKTELDKVERS